MNKTIRSNSKPQGLQTVNGKIVLPENNSQLKHIFRNASGHMSDTPENRDLLLDTANNSFPQRTDSFGNQWYYSNQSNGTQVWVQVRNGTIQNGGLNLQPITFPTSNNNNSSSPKQNNKKP